MLNAPSYTYSMTGLSLTTAVFSWSRDRYLAAARRAGRPVLHLRHQLHRHGNPDPGDRVAAQLGPRPGQVQDVEHRAGGQQGLRGAHLYRLPDTRLRLIDLIN